MKLKCFKAILKVGILTASMAALMAFPAFAAGNGQHKLTKNTLAEMPDFPFEVNIETDYGEDRLCYTGSGSKFQKGLCVTPDADFSLTSINPDADIENLKIDVAVMYYDEETKENLFEQVGGWDYGQLSEDTNYLLIPEDKRDELEDKDRLYSGYDRSLEMKLTYKAEDKKEQKMYFYVATDEEFSVYSAS